MENFIDSTLTGSASLIQENMLSSLNQYLGKDTIELLPELAVSFQEQTVHLLNHILNALVRHDTNLMQISASKMKLLCTSMGFHRLARLAKWLELCGMIGDWQTAVSKIDQFQIEYANVRAVLKNYAT